MWNKKLILENSIRFGFSSPNLILETTEQFVIPEPIRNFYKIKGDIGNIKNWQAKILKANSAREGVKVGDWETPRYVMISLTTNNIIPIAISDEHNVGYDVLSFILRKYKLENHKYESMCCWGNHYFQSKQPKAKELNMKLFKKFLSYGGNPELRIEDWDSHYTGSVESYCKGEGDVTIKKGEMSAPGKRIINYFEAIARGAKARDKYVFKTALNFKKYIQDNMFSFMQFIDGNVNEYCNQFEKMVTEAEAKENYEALFTFLYSFKGMKNNIHNKLRKAIDGNSDYEKNRLIKVFGDIEFAKLEFDRLGNI